MKYVFKIKLAGLSKPDVWRTIAIPGNYTFFKFHKVIQIAFGWENLHFFEFIPKDSDSCTHIYMPHEDDLDDSEMNFSDATSIKVEEVMERGITHLSYIYDRNDNWEHEITLESSSEDTPKRPICLAGGGMCPPEGCGGVLGYEHIKKILEGHQDNAESKRCREWLFMDDDDIFDPAYFTDTEIAEINDIFNR